MIKRVKRMQRMGSINASSTKGTSAGVSMHTLVNTTAMPVSASPVSALSNVNWMMWGLIAGAAYLLLKSGK